jgi:hypothetical protein
MQEGSSSPSATAPPAAAPDNSRTSKKAAGWDGPRRGPYGARWERLLAQRRRTLWGNFTWISPGPLLASINDQVAKGLDDLVNDRRARWVAAARGGDWRDEKLTIKAHSGKDEVSFLIVGDPGEQDASQYATVAPLLAAGGDTDFMVIASDVIYPAGDINDYLDGFYLPYRDYGAPIYALPGNHDWYDGLNGFMFHFCGVEPLAPVTYRAGGYTWRERLARLLWRNPSPPDLAELVRERDKRSASDDPWRPPQPASYYTIDTPRLRIVCIDTGITGVLDREQGDWLRRVSRDDPRDKVLITGKPIYVDGEYHPGKIDWGVPKDATPDAAAGEADTIDAIVRDPDHRYVAAIGGDVHNYQHYPVEVDGRRIDYVVSGGGGAYLSATHRFGKVSMAPGEPEDLPEGTTLLPPGTAPVTEEQVTLYPLRGDSLTRFVARFTPMLGAALGLALLVLLAGVGVFVVDQNGLTDSVDVLAAQGADRTSEGAGPARWLAILVGLGSAALVWGVAWAAFRASRSVARGYRTFSATTVTVAVVSLLIAIVYRSFPDEWHWIWRMGASTALAIVLPLAFVVGYYLVRDFIPASVRVAIALLPALAFGVSVLAREVGAETAAAPFIVFVALMTLWLTVAWVGALRLQGARPKEDKSPLAAALVGQFSAKPKRRSEHKWRRRIGQLLPPVVGSLGMVALLVAIPNDHPTAWIPTGILWITIALIILAALFLFAVSYRAFAVWPGWYLSPYLDPDEVARWLADELDCDEPVRDSAKSAVPSTKTKRLAALTLHTWPFKRFLSELAEATRPPFFKSFLRLDLEGDTLTISNYGVSGHLDDESSPAVEQRIEIPISTP